MLLLSHLQAGRRQAGFLGGRLGHLGSQASPPGHLIYLIFVGGGGEDTGESLPERGDPTAPGKGLEVQCGVRETLSMPDWHS